MSNSLQLSLESPVWFPWFPLDVRCPSPPSLEIYVPPLLLVCIHIAHQGLLQGLSHLLVVSKALSPRKAEQAQLDPACGTAETWEHLQQGPASSSALHSSRAHQRAHCVPQDTATPLALQRKGPEFGAACLHVTSCSPSPQQLSPALNACSAESTATPQGHSVLRPMTRTSKGKRTCWKQ